MPLPLFYNGIRLEIDLQLSEKQKSNSIQNRLWSWNYGPLSLYNNIIVHSVGFRQCPSAQFIVVRCLVPLWLYVGVY